MLSSFCQAIPKVFSSILIIGISGCASSDFTLTQSDSTLTPTSTQTPSLNESAAIGIANAERLAALEASLQPIEIPSIEKKPLPVFDLWQRALDSFQLDLSAENRRIKLQRNWYDKHQDYMDRVALRASRYLFHVVEQIEQHEMPGELALLPIVESAYEIGRASCRERVLLIV